MSRCIRNTLALCYLMAQVALFPMTSLGGVSEFGIETVLRIDHEVALPLGLQHKILSEEELASQFSLKNGVYIYSGDQKTPGMQLKYGDRTSLVTVQEGALQESYDRRDYLLDIVRKQADYLYGVFQDPSFLSSVDRELGLRGDDRIKDDLGFGGLGESAKVRLYVKQVSDNESLISYTYSVRAIVNRKILKAMEEQAENHGDPTVEITVTLPKRVEEDLIYPKNRNGEPLLKMCTDHHYTGFGDYWYFFKPFDPKCKSKLQTPKYQKLYDSSVKIKLRPLNEDEVHQMESATIFPEYSELYKNGELRIDAFIGYDEVNWGDEINLESSKALADQHREDVAAIDFEETLKFLQRKGFRQDNHRSKRAFTYGYHLPNGDDSSIPIDPSVRYEPLSESGPAERPTFSGISHSMTLLKTLQPPTLFGKRRTVQIRLHLVDTSITSPDTTFALLWKEALENSQVIFYGGHSGLGGNLNVSNLNERHLELSLSPLNMPKETYQLIFFDGCSTYGYYNRQYFQQKSVRKRSGGTTTYVPGTKFLDIINTGLQSDFARTLGNLWAMLRISTFCPTGHEYSSFQNHDLQRFLGFVRRF